MALAISVPPMPEIGRPEEYYLELIKESERAGDMVGRMAWKVGQYVTLALDQNLPWPEKARYFEYAVQRHCIPPMGLEAVVKYTEDLKKLVMQHAGEEAMRIASKADDEFAKRLSRGAPRAMICREATQLFKTIIGDTSKKPEYYNVDDWKELKVLLSGWSS